jgi:hypothetical protein
MWNNIDEFTKWYQDNGYPFKPPAGDPIYVTDHTLSSIIFREGRYQVELYLLAPNWITPNHGHPGINHRIIFLNGTVGGSKNGTFLNDSFEWCDNAREDGCNILFGFVNDFTGDDYHQVYTGHRGGLVAITQEWDEGLIMSSQSVQYIGESIGPEHEHRVNLNNLIT